MLSNLGTWELILHYLANGRADGEPLDKDEISFNPEWLTWNNSTVGKLAEAIYEHRIFAEPRHAW